MGVLVAVHVLIGGVTSLLPPLLPPTPSHYGAQAAAPLLWFIIVVGQTDYGNGFGDQPLGAGLVTSIISAVCALVAAIFLLLDSCCQDRSKKNAKKAKKKRERAALEVSPRSQDPVVCVCVRVCGCVCVFARKGGVGVGCPLPAQPSQEGEWISRAVIILFLPPPSSPPPFRLPIQARRAARREKEAEAAAGVGTGEKGEVDTMDVVVEPISAPNADNGVEMSATDY